MSNAATITLPWPPSVNNYWGHRVCGTKQKQFVSVYVTKEGEAYRKAVKAAVVRRWPGSIRAVECRLDVTIVVNAPTRRARDLDNLGKAILDGLASAGVYANDSQIDRLEFVRSGKIGQPGTVDVTLRMYEGAKCS